MLGGLSYLFLALLGLGGIQLAGYIRYKKTHHQVMTCPLGSNCETVTHSQFSRFFGVPVEIIGLAYYTVVTLAYGAFFALPSLVTVHTAFVAVVLTTVAFLFSLYLTFIQAVTLRQWCTWCLASAAMCTAIFLLTVFGTEHHIINVLEENHRALLGVHLLGLAFGLAGATITDVLFFKFLKDFRISHMEVDIMHTLSQIIWFGISVLLLSGIGLYLANMDALNHSSKFLTKVVVVGVIIVNGAFLNLFVSPKLIHISFGSPHRHVLGELRHWRRIAFALGAISATSWYSAFMLGVLRSVPLSVPQLLTLYGTLLFGAIVSSQVIGYGISRRARTLSDTTLISDAGDTVGKRPGLK